MWVILFLRFFLGLLNLLTSPESGLWFAFAEKQVTLLHQEVACQCPEACLWRHLVTRVIGSCLGVSSLVVTHGGHRHSVHSPHATRSRAGPLKPPVHLTPPACRSWQPPTKTTTLVCGHSFNWERHGQTQHRLERNAGKLTGFTYRKGDSYLESERSWRNSTNDPKRQSKKRLHFQKMDVVTSQKSIRNTFGFPIAWVWAWISANS